MLNLYKPLFLNFMVQMSKMRFLYILFVGFSVFSQEKLPDFTFIKVDSLYREDQFYFSITYNRLRKTPENFTQNGLSTGFNLGFLRDMPFNKKRTFALALGLGISYNKYHQNLKVSENGATYIYEVVNDAEFSKNKLEQVFVDIPMELRWRNATPESHKFWRVYSGFKFRYLVFDKIKHVGTSEITITNNRDFNKLQFGPYLSFGFNTWNFHIYYGLNPIFSSAKTSTEKIESKTLNIGLIFYIL